MHKKSNHPPSILKNIPDSINKRLSEISSDRHRFDNAKTVYQEALNKSGYNYNLSYNEPRNEIQYSRKNRPRNILWYNPPFRKNVKTNIGKCFLSLIDQHFPNSHSLHKTFNTNTLKLTYSCMTNIKTIISNHNKAEINKSDPTNDSNCNCRNSSMCPMHAKCNDQNVIYQAEVTTTTSRETYIGLCDKTFKLRYRNHVCSFKNERYKHATELSKYIWSLKDKSIPYNFKWRKVKQARSYSNISKRCNLCLWEKYFIIYKPDMSTLNNRSELVSNCRHSKKFLLKSLKDRSIPYNFKWRKVKQARSYSNIGERCNLCLWEKYVIIYKPDMSTLNNRSELVSNCRHSKKFLLKNVLAYLSHFCTSR